jgi:hypothetical protein
MHAINMPIMTPAAIHSRWNIVLTREQLLQPP